MVREVFLEEGDTEKLLGSGKGSSKSLRPTSHPSCTLPRTAADFPHTGQTGHRAAPHLRLHQQPRGAAHPGAGGRGRRGRPRYTVPIPSGLRTPRPLALLLASHTPVLCELGLQEQPWEWPCSRPCLPPATLPAWLCLRSRGLRALSLHPLFSVLAQSSPVWWEWLAWRAPAQGPCCSFLFPTDSGQFRAALSCM